MIRCSRCGLDLEPDAFAPSHQTTGDWCRSCRREYMSAYYKANPSKFRKPSRCSTCGEVRPLIGGCLNGCVRAEATAPPVLRTSTCTICKSPFVLPLSARSNLRTCTSPSCREIRAKQAKAQGAIGRTRGGKGAHHSGGYHVHARRVREMAQANPDQRCWRCGRTLDEHKPHKNGKPAKWTAGHVVDGQVGGPLAPEASTCNYTAGAIAGNQQRRRTDLTW